MKNDLQTHALFREIMKITLNQLIILLVMTGVSVAGTSISNAQEVLDKQLTLNIKNQPIKDVLSSIENKAKVKFAYTLEAISSTDLVSVSANNEKLDEVLDKLLIPRKINYQSIGNHIVLNQFMSIEKENLFKVEDVVEVISGKVTSEDGKPIPGVNVVLKGTAIGTATDIDGKYIINAPPDGTLIFSFIGYTAQEVVINGRTTIDVALVEDSQTLEEIVVTGYSSQKKGDITGSVSVVDMTSINKTAPGSAQEALQGLASGVNVINSGIPGRASKIFIRGVTSFGNTDPLVIVDGIEQDLHNINANEIETIQVLKDAGASAIYGVRGANGVIVVTTKKGKAGTPIINYEGYSGMQYPLPGNPYDVMNSEDWMNAFNIANPGNELFKNGMPDYTFRSADGAGAAMEGDPAVDPSLYFYEPKNTGNNYIIQKVNKVGEDWFHNIFKRAPTMRHSINASGGTEKTKYFFGLGYYNQQGTMVETFEKRYSARINTEFKVRENIRIGENANIIYQQVPQISGALTGAFRMVPLVPLKDIMGNWAGTFGGPDLGVIGQTVAVQTRNTEKDLNSTWNIIGNAYGEVDFLKNFMARTSIGYNIANVYNQDFTATQTENIEQSTRDNKLNVNSNYGSTMTWTNTLSYSNVFHKHDVKLLLGSEAIEYTSRGVIGGSDKFFSEDFNYLVVNNGTSNISASSWIIENSLFSLFGRLDYSYNGKYLMGVTLRRDGSSRFGPDKRYGFFPSVSLGWRISDEIFMKGLSWLDDLKLRGSYGVLGSQNNVNGDNSFFLYGTGLRSTYYDIKGTSTSTVLGFAQSRIGNFATGWEENIISNFGFDVSVLEGKLEASLEYYKKAINGLLFPEPLPAVVLGDATAPTVNIGNIQNSGIDASFRYRNKIKNDLYFSAGLNITSYKNEVVDIPDPGYFYSNRQYGIGSIVRNEVGHPVSSYYGYKILGLFNSDQEVADSPTQSGAAPGRFRYQDTDNDGVITADDRIHLGNPNPDFTYGLTLALDYKGFDLSGIFYGSQGNELYNALKVYTHFFQSYKEQKSNALLNAWTPENTNTTVPKIESTPSFSTNQTSNSYYIEDGSYLRLKSLIFGYTVQPIILERVGISKLRIYAQAANLFTITKYSGLDPELGGSSSSFGIDKGGYPNNEFSLIFGLNLSL